MNTQRIQSVIPRPPSTLEITWRSGRKTSVDIVEFFGVRGHSRLKIPAFFRTVAVEEWGHGVEWNNGAIGIDADTLWRLGKEQSGSAFPVSEFNDWMSRNRLSLSAAAKALGLTRRTVVYYHGGHKPIPLTIKLACIGWESLHSKRAA